MHHRRQFARFTAARAAAAASAAIGIMLACAASALTAPPLGDTYIVGSGTNLTKNYGAATTLGVGAGASTLIQFNLAALPAGTLPTDVASATLLLYVNKVTTPGTVALQLVSAAWSEGAVTGKTAPAAASAFTSVGVPGTALGQYVLVDVTAQVKVWIGASSTNNGFMLTPAATAPTTNVFFDSKETGGNAPALEITLALRGPTGATGAAGAQGPAGAKGDTGAQGQTGANGAPGSAGAQGPAGPAGLRGPAGAYTWVDKNGNFVGVADGIGVALAAIGQAKVHISIGDFPPIQNTKVGDNNRAFLAQVGVYYLSTNCSGQAYVPMSQVSTGDNRASGGMYDLAGNAVLFLGDDAVSQSLAYGSTKSDASVCDINPGTTLLIPANASYLLNTLFPPPLRIQ